MSQQTDSQNRPRVEFRVHFQTGHCGRRHLTEESCRKKPEHNENLPRLTRLLALAHRWNSLIEEGVVANYSEIARMMGLSRARVTQIMDLLYLAPDIQEEILLQVESRLATVPERAVRSITGLLLWKKQYKVWKETIGDD